MRVLVTGASGFVGRHVSRLLQDCGEDVIEWHFADLNDNRDTAIDLCDAAAVARQDLRKLDAVVHLAGLAQVSRSFAEPAAYMTVNSTVVTNLFEALLGQSSFPRVLVVSTGGIYAATTDVVTEGSRLDPSNPYVVSKMAQENLASYYAKRGFDVIIARPFNHIGPGQQPGFLVSDICSKIAELERRGGGTLTVGDLASSRDYTDVRDVAEAYRALINAGRSGETYNVCSGSSHTGEEIVQMLRELAKVTITPERAASLARPTDASIVRASSEKLHRATGWSPVIPLETTLAQTLDYWRSQPAAGTVN
jgi:GDP-4-dehydro-6-deoxy-D-mannose reductase